METNKTRPLTVEEFITKKGLVEAPKDYDIRAGDLIRTKGDSWTGDKIRIVSRVTKTAAITGDKDTYEYKYQRVYGFWFSRKPRIEWDRNEYKVYIKEAVDGTEHKS